MSPARPSQDARRAAGRLCFVDFPGVAPSALLERLIDQDHIGGVVLFRKNVASATQAAALAATLQAIARGARGSPLWVAIDHEGGMVTRFPGGTAAGAGPRATALPSAMALGAAGDPALARQAGQVAGRELRAMGIHLNFAPVMDVNSHPANPVIGVRAFGETSSLVEAMGLAYIAGLQDAGVAATAKHFPGHGDVTVDSHVGLPWVNHGLDRLEAVELPPFAAAVRAGAAAIMTAHIVHPALDPSGVPATMSAPILCGILRERLGFRGLVCTDSMGMRAIVDHFGVGDAAVASVKAGCDVVLALGPEALQEEVLAHLAGAIESGEIAGGRVAEALARIDAAASRWVRGRVLDAAAAASPPADLSGVVGTPDHKDIAGRIAAAAVTLVRDRTGVTPLAGARIGVVAVAQDSEEWGRPDLAGSLRRHGATVREYAPLDSLSGVDHVIAATCSRGTLPPAQVEAVRALYRQTGDRLVVVATGDPYDLLQFPEIPAYLVTYGSDETSLDAAAQVLLGGIPPRGRLPVSLPGAYSLGHGMTGGSR